MNRLLKFSYQTRANMMTTSRIRDLKSMLYDLGNPKITLCLLYGFYALILCNSSNEAASITPNGNSSNQPTWRLIKRAEWKARPPKTVTNFTGPSPYLIVHHSYQPGVCHSQDACKASMRSMQNYHMDHNHWEDIGYSFAIGGDGNVYEGRGYNIVGAHAPNYNNRSIGLLLIGDFDSELPPLPMLEVAKDFIKFSVETGELHEDYIMYGHRQVRNTECPGDALYGEITKWPHWREVETSQ